MQRLKALPLEELLQGVRINNKRSLEKMLDILEIYSRPATKMNLAILFSDDYLPCPHSSIAKIVSERFGTCNELIWREEYSEIMTLR